MENVYYYIYCKGILGVKTNIFDFKWVYGSVAPAVSVEEYEKCVVKFDVRIKPEKQLSESDCFDQRFQSYVWDSASKTISCRRTLFFNFNIGYNVKINENTVFAEIGEHYYKFVKNRTMNLHGMYYLLSDLANVMLLNNGFLTLYASAVYRKSRGNCIVNFAPPNTGKTFTATTLCKISDYALLGEDVVISDGHKVYSCPWTSTYRTSNSKMSDSAGSLGRSTRSMKVDVQDSCDLTDLVVLSIGEKRIDRNKELILKQVSILNGYIFNYFSSPIIKLLGYFDEDYYKSWSKYAESMLQNLVNANNCYRIQSENSADFAKILHEIVSGENYEGFSDIEKCLG